MTASAAIGVQGNRERFLSFTWAEPLRFRPASFLTTEPFGLLKLDRPNKSGEFLPLRFI
jgi:hypothetical protein